MDDLGAALRFSRNGSRSALVLVDWKLRKGERMKIKNMNALDRVVVRREGKKKSLSIAQVKEVLGIVSDLLARDYEVTLIQVLYRDGLRRKRAKQRKRK